jgi:hypothetical protein
MTTDIFPDGDYTFIQDGGSHYDERGKVHWPALLRVEMTERGAWLLMKQLLNILDDPNGVQDGRLAPQITFVGTIERRNDDGNTINMDGTS